MAGQVGNLFFSNLSNVSVSRTNNTSSCVLTFTCTITNGASAVRTAGFDLYVDGTLKASATDIDINPQSPSTNNVSITFTASGTDCSKDIEIRGRQTDPQYAGYVSLPTGRSVPYYNVTLASVTLTTNNTGIVVPNQSYNATWSITKGINSTGGENGISAIRIRYTLPDGSWANVSTGSTATSGTYSVPTTDLSRGTRSRVYVGVYSEEKNASNVNYTISATKNGVLINSLPSSPTASANPSVIESAQNVVFTASGSTDVDASQTISYYYATSAGGTKTIMPSGTITLPISADTTIYVWAFDGLEYSTNYSTAVVRLASAKSLWVYTADGWKHGSVWRYGTEWKKGKLSVYTNSWKRGK